jgi:hypothetical protein
MLVAVRQGRPALAILLIAVIFLCQVLAALCTMLPPVATADRLMGDHGPMAMGETGACQASLPASPKGGGKAEGAFFAAASLASTVMAQGPLLRAAFSSPSLYPGESGPPLYARLSTFRI